ncbi:hypothetical protein ABIA33_004235 [Streptacidiphilus sp. MAP12-16]|uniref:SMI1/KNR4 family protein n=1 Tax=Streptacidiphilus sp. MAP12-16 TaxID=3156300 RepID=UPI003514797E
MRSSSAAGELADLLGYPVGEGDRTFEWPAVEASLGGVALPSDYKTLVETFPRGRFQGAIRLIRPGDHGYPRTEYLGYFRSLLDHLSEMKLADQTACPYPIFPQPGGIIPWGERQQGDLVFWLPNGPDSDAWPTLVHDSERRIWQEVPLGVADLLLQAVKGKQPFYELDEEIPVKEAPLREKFWDELGVPNGVPSQSFDLLVNLLGARRAERSFDWADISEKTDVKFPADYINFMDQYGPGVFCDVRLCDPSSAGEHGFTDLVSRVRRAAQDGRGDRWSPPIYPDAGGLIPWGETEDGWICGWAPASSRPDEWGVVVSRGNMDSYSYRPDDSFSSFLVKHANPARIASVFTGRDPWSKPVVFSSFSDDA